MIKTPVRVACLAALLTTLTTGAHAGGEVNVYSYRQPFLIKPMFAAFTRETGVEVNVVFAQKGLVERLEREGANSPADLIFTVDISRLTDAKAAGVTQAADSAVLERNIPASYRDPERHWFGLTIRARIIVAARGRLDPAEVPSYASLADPKLAGRVCTRSGKHIYMVGLVASMIAHDGEAATRAWLDGVKSNRARKPQGNDRAQVKAIAEGVCDVAIINHYYMGKMMNDEKQAAWAEAVDIVFPDQAGRGTHVNVSGVALTRGAPNRDNAIRLMEFLSGDLAQQMYAEQNFEYPVKPGVPWSGLLTSFGRFKADDTALAEIAGERAAAARLVDEVDFDG